MKRIDKFAVALVAAWILQALLSPAVVHWYATGAENGKMVTTNAITMVLYVDAVRCILVGVVCGVWLFVEAKRERETAWVWCLVGLVGSAIGIVLFYAYMIWQNTRVDKMANQHLRATPTAVTPPAGQEARQP